MGPRVVTLEALGVGWWGLGESEGEAKRKEREKAEEEQAPSQGAWLSLGLEAYTKYAGSVASPAQRPSEWLSTGAQGDGERC